MSERVIDRKEILSILESGNFDELLGLIENHWLEFKQEPYRLNTELGKIKLSKDVSSLANVEGGYILIGLKEIKRRDHIDSSALK